jgi:hypothetical protein
MLGGAHCFCENQLSRFQASSQNKNLQVSPIMTSVAYVIGPSVIMSSIDFPFQNLVFWNLFEFSMVEIT